MAFEQLDPVRYQKVEPANTDILPVVASFFQNFFSGREKRRQDTSEAFAGPLKKVLFSNISMALIRHFSITLFFGGREATTGNASAVRRLLLQRFRLEYHQEPLDLPQKLIKRSRFSTPS